MQAKTIRSVFTALLAWNCLLSGGILTAHADVAPAVPIPTTPADPFAWDSLLKEQATTNGQTAADFFFSVTNISSAEAVIERVQTSCGCTVAKLPSNPWVLAPHSDGKINVTVDLHGKSGTLFKTITVFSTNTAPKNLTVKVVIPENPEMARSRNQQMALADRQAVFKNDCARCHVEPTHGKSGKDLYAVACGICHEAEHRATMVPDLHALNHSTDQIYWKQWITTGKVGTLMPAFATDQGGPLSAEQIDSIADYLDKAIPHTPAAPSAKLSPPQTIPGTDVIAPTPPPIPVK
ncbi:MAG: hypothetical protein JWR69_1390 [Pedosphaera sp.]|nr:hypothetical protein [Pedosphaera sp.]